MKLTASLCSILVALAMLSASAVAQPALPSAPPASALGAHPVTESKSAKPITEMLIDFARYAKWSGDRAGGALKICFVGYVPSQSEILGARQQAQRPFQSVEMVEVSSPEAARGCHVLWLAANVRPAPRHWLRALPQADTLTFSDHADFAVDGGIVAVWRDQADWRYEINVESLQRSGILLSASVLRLSKRVR